MDRKQFLRRAALFSLAAAGLPGVANAFQTRAKEDEYKKTSKETGGGEHVYKTRFYQDKVLSPDDGDTRIVLEVTFYAGYSWAADAEANARSGRYTLQRTGTPSKEGDYTITKWKLLPKTDGEDVMKGKFEKTVVMKLKPRRHLIFELAGGESLQLSFENPNASDPYDDCFLTTACTAARGLPDDCAELTTLRLLRDVHMKPTVKGAALIADYYSIAPGIVEEVNTRANRQEIWNLVYQELVLPVVALTQAGEIDAAISSYAEYTGWMKEAFSDLMIW